MAKVHTSYVCQQCGFISAQNLGRCPECGAWGSLVETIEQKSSAISRQSSAGKKVLKDVQLVNLRDVERTDYARISTNIREFDRVLGGGVVLGSVMLIAGDPGIGKSTLLSQLAINIPKTLYVAGEESAHQIKLRIDRLKKDADLAILNEVDVDVIIEVIRQVKPPLVIIDSIQTMETQDLESAAGAVGQVKETAHRLQRAAKSLHIPIFIVGHVTKEGTVAGPRTLEHMVDVVLNLEGDPSSGFRILRGIKNRFGPTDEIGVFEMEDYGLKEVTNPSKLFLDQKVNAPGSAVVVTVNGARALLVEIQALVSKSFLPIPRRTGSGIDNNRLQLLVAVISKRLSLPLFDQDIFVNVTGGMKLTEPAVDLGVCMAIISSLKDRSIVSQAAFVGEVGLLGELRNVRQLDKRLSEAKKLGFTQLISSESVKSLGEAVNKGLTAKEK
ncbi:DNA repair protein RadA [Candidatus Daviesbacteria bacterium RIFCSPHIGHO2_01_FULL_44_29]|uniref:DNA repair protein RadA n=1 Tax=Candidatus Daviesbacteria bacterium RIFCSPHIGHO2_02_FULL_43_12 TaxID=1797776 RepID=A0A1F5KHH2_9BACT|nr:MAG: DNA repair protein RadA [Candidatus Daviesbacteria bacterium RIFCSPHIGHO2_01_FULL_44_29]OGE39439.1 MAG: DNA repair protein RadA [Candidatus Daviesbacteria bacterium RIFCSPHIGHO2_12_FULL_47_45]OGE40338.1 MAG: DNA repair protein RadA [Candidatus Daviesbacteria bacterium RIFCSPHIGHO2_02_FULL_43_12]OGE69743.1 MAG: DNA repair protein RadA [Candidatus Daviesbacteria bacterium RIFCSPLOWO2_01_FULL_43_15]